MPMKTNHLRLAVSNIGFAAEEDEKVWRFMQRLGYEGLEIAPTRLVGTPVSYTHLDVYKRQAEGRAI